MFCPIPMASPRLVPAGGSTVDSVAPLGGYDRDLSAVHAAPARCGRVRPGEVDRGPTERNGLFFAFAADGWG